jgi:hypothetical protein
MFLLLVAAVVVEPMRQAVAAPVATSINKVLQSLVRLQSP